MDEEIRVAVSERAVLRKFRKEDDGALSLYEAIVLLDGKVIEVWKAESGTPPPED